jgi:hypothetical protein
MNEIPTTPKVLRELELNPNPRGPIITIPDAFEGGQTLQRLLPFLDKILWQDVRVIVCVHDDSPEVLDVELYVRKYPNRCAVVRRPDDSRLQQFLACGDVAIFPGAKDDLPPRFFGPALKAGVTTVVHANLVVRQDLARMREEEGNTTPCFLFYQATRESLWDAVWAALTSLQKTTETVAAPAVK